VSPEPLSPLVDDDARRRIREALDETLAVEAAAGTGKTTVLVDRIVNVLASGRTTVDRIVAVTFTEKAAGELKLRLRTKLEARRATSEPVTRASLDRALANLEQAHVSTIHTFCADLLRERPVEAGVDPQFSMFTEPQAARLFGEVFRDWLQQRLEAPPPGVRRALRRSSFADDGGPMGRLERAAWTLAEWRDFGGSWRREGFDAPRRVAALLEELATFHALTGEPADREDPLFVSVGPARRLHDERTLAEQVRPRDHDGLEARLVDLCSWTFRNPRVGRKTSPYRRGLPRTQVVEAHTQLVTSLERFKRDADADLAACLRDELSEVVERYGAAKRRHGALDFLDLLVAARDLVRDHPAVRTAFQARFTHLFVDEFQDTDPLQAEILLLLASSDPEVRDWRAVTPTPGKLFVVGDPKQSIYRFRRADVGIYEEVRAQLARQGAVCLELTTSFRSVPAIQRVVNAAFAPRMTGDAATLQASYVALSPVRADAADQPAVVALPVPHPIGWRGQVTKKAVTDSLPDAVGAFVDWLVTRSGWRVTDRDQPDEPRAVTARDVCLLFRRFDTRVYDKGGSRVEDVTRPYVQALEARGIPHLLVGGKSFHDREEIETMRTALAAVEWPDDELSVFGTVRGALFAVGDEALFEYRRLAGRLNPFRRPDGEAAEHLRPIVEALDLLRELHVRRNHRPVADTIARLLEASRAHAMFALRPSGEQALANVQYIAELARQYEVGGGVSFRGFVDQLREEAESTRAAEAPILEEGSDGVRIMTAHRAKGLEFPVVVLADITAELSRGTASRWIDGTAGRFAVSLAGWAPADLLDHEATEVARDAAEGVRVAYVAATRARDLLVVPAVGDEPYDAGWVSPLNAALYPPLDARREVSPAAWTAHFGPDSVLDREASTPYSNVRPGVHVITESAGASAVAPSGLRRDEQERRSAEEHEPGAAPSPRLPARRSLGEVGRGEGWGEGTTRAITWWDPGALDLGRQPAYGLRREELIAKDAPAGVIEAGLQRFRLWRRGHDETVEAGARPSLRVLTVRARAAQPPEAGDAAPPVRIEQARAARGPRPSGPRFGALVHAVLAVAPLDADDDSIEAVARQQARALDADEAEVTAAVSLVSEVLTHDLLVRARVAAQAGRLRREAPVTLASEDGTLLEGVVDLAFEEEAGWTIVDFKTDVELGPALDTYLRQVQLYAAAIAGATGRPAIGVLLRI
jgi:ATP-dependent exoDNAse (exonuclease V) beta subunit